MPVSTVVAADLDFEVSVPGAAPVRGTLRGDSNSLVLEVDDPGAFAGGGDAPVVRALADGLASWGVVITVVHDGVPLVRIGATRAPWWQRRVTGSRHIRLAGLGGAWTALRSRSRSTDPLLPAAALVPPPTMLPIVPTLQRRPRRVVTTTHDPTRGGAARLVMASASGLWTGAQPRVLWLNDDVTTLGSDPTCDIVLPGLAGLHARIRHSEDDEFVLEALGPDVRVHGALMGKGLLRTGARVELGTWRLAYYREEFADHGRPYGGRIGGELGRQRPQPPRTTQLSPWSPGPSQQ